MKRRRPQAVGNLMDAYFEKMHLTEEYRNASVITSWQQVATKELSQSAVKDLCSSVLGDHILKFTDQLKIKNQVLYIHFTSAPLRQEFSMRKLSLMRNLNESAGYAVIKDIVFQ